MQADTGRRARVILRRRQAYRAIFLNSKSAPRRGRTWFTRLLDRVLGRSVLWGDPTPMAEIVLADLRRACCADRPTTVIDHDGRVDALATAKNEGRREIWLRVQQALHLPDDAIYRMLDAAEITK